MWRQTSNEMYTGRKIALAACWVAALVLLSCAAHADPTPEGLWRTIDDATGKAKSMVRIVENAGVLSGRVEQVLDPDPGWNGRCSKCTDQRRDQPVLGMLILTNLRKAGDEYSGGEILDPDNGNVYRCRVKLVEDGRKLEVRGFIGISLFGRTQVWVREK